MSSLSRTAIQLGDNQVTIDAEALAPKLGLTVEALKENMARGHVMGVVETGMDEDAGRVRLTFRYGTRVWRIVIEPDGRLIEDPAPAAKAAPKAGPFKLLDLMKTAP